MRAFIHIGGHKTGSTYIQDRLKNSTSVLAECGLEYPTLGDTLPGHHGLAAELKSGEPGPELALLRKVSQASRRDLIISSENFEDLDAPRIKLLTDCLEGRDLRAVYYLRSWADTSYGFWQEGVKHARRVATYPTFLLQEFLAPRMRTVLDYRIGLDAWTDVIGVDALTVIPYEMVPKGELFRSLLKLTNSEVPGGVDAALKGRRGRRNERLSPEEVELLRVLNTYAIRDGLRAPTTRIFEQMGSSARIRNLSDAIVDAMGESRKRVPDVNKSRAASEYFSRFFDDFTENVPLEFRTDAENYLGLKRKPVFSIESDYLLDRQTLSNYEDLWGLIGKDLRIGSDLEHLPSAATWSNRFRAAMRSRRR